MSLQKRNINWVSSLKIKEMEVFIELSQVKSVRELARRRGIQPGQISKLLSAMEQKMGERLFDRSISGVTLTTTGQAIKRQFEKAIDALHEIQASSSISKKGSFVIGASNLLSTHLLPKVLSYRSFADYDLSLLDMAPQDYIPNGLRGIVSICIHFDKLDWPSTWYSEKISDIEWELVARKKHQIFNKKITQKEILKYPFVYPTYLTNEGISTGEDQFYLPKEDRLIGIKTSTALTAIELVKNTDQLGYFPSVITGSYIKNKHLQRVPIPVKKRKKAKLFLSVKADQVSNEFFKLLKQKLVTGIGR